MTQKEKMCSGIGSAAAETPKHVAGKLRYALIPCESLRELAAVFTFGAEKYWPHSWKLGIPYSECLSAAFRHIEAFRSGETMNCEDSKPVAHHLAHAAFWLLAVVYFEKSGGYDSYDDRAGKPEEGEK